MATLAQFEQDQNKQQPNDNQGGGGQVLNSSGGDASGVSSIGASSPSSAPRTPISSTPNIQQYLQANQGAGQNLAQGIQSNVQSQAQGLNQQVGSAQQKLNAQYQPLQQNLSGGQQTIQSAFQNPQQLLDAYNASKSLQTGQALNDQQQQALSQYNQFQQLNTGGYNPAIQSYGTAAQQYGTPLQSQLQDLQNQAKLANTESGRSQLLQNTVAQPNYSIGQQSLDNLFLQAQPGVANQLKQNLGNISTQSTQNLNQANQDVQSKLAALNALSTQNQQYAKNLFTGQGEPGQLGLGGITSNVANEYAQAQQNQPIALSQVQQAATQNQFTPEQLQQLGLGDSYHAWGVNLNPYISANQLQAANAGGNAQVATPEEFARYNALNQVLGGPSGTAQASIFGGAQQAGGFNPVNFDKAGFETAVQGQKSALTGADFKNAFSGIAPQIQAAYGVEAPGIVNSINKMISDGKSPQEVMDALNAIKGHSGQFWDYSNWLHGQGANQGFAEMASDAYGKSLTPYEQWLQKTYQPAENDILGTGAIANSSPGHIINK